MRRRFVISSSISFPKLTLTHSPSGVIRFPSISLLPEFACNILLTQGQSTDDALAHALHIESSPVAWAVLGIGRPLPRLSICVLIPRSASSSVLGSFRARGVEGGVSSPSSRTLPVSKLRLSSHPSPVSVSWNCVAFSDPPVESPIVASKYCVSLSAEVDDWVDVSTVLIRVAELAEPLRLSTHFTDKGLSSAADCSPARFVTIDDT